MTTKNKSMDRKKLILRSLQTYYRIDIENIEEYFDTIESLFEEELKKFSKRIDKRTKGMTKADKDFLIDLYIDDYQKLSDVFPYMQRNSIFIVTFSAFENELNSICKVLGRNSNLKVELKDLNGRGIERAKLYLEKVAEINFPKNSKFWTEIKIFNHIRNLVVHNEGRLKKNDKNSRTVKEYIEKSSLLKLDGREKILYKKNFIPHVLATFNQFFKILFSNIDKSWNISNKS